MSVPRQGILLVGGHGTRMRPLTDTRPKHLLPVGGAPLLDLVVDRLVAAGVEHLALAVSVHADLVVAHLEHRSEELAARGCRWVASREATPLGTGGAVVTAAHGLEPEPDEAVVVVNGDLLTGHDLKAQAALLDPATDVVLHVRPAADPAPFGTVRCDDEGVVRHFAEKVPGPPGTLVNAGTYVVRASLLLSHPPGRPASWERDLLPRALADGVGVRAHVEDAWFADVGSPEALVAASAAVADGSAGAAVPPGYRPELLRRGTVDPGADVCPVSALGAGSLVRAGARVRRSVLLDGAVVESDAVVEDTVLGAGARVGTGARVVRAALGDGATVAAGVAIEPATRVGAGESVS